MRCSIAAFALLTVVLVCPLWGCGSGSSPSDTNASRIVGTWRQVTLQVNKSAPTTCPTILTGTGSAAFSCSANSLLTYHADGTLTSVTEGAGSRSGTYTLSGSTLTVTFNPPNPATSSFTIRFDNGQLVETFVSTAGDSVQGVLQRQ